MDLPNKLQRLIEIRGENQALRRLNPASSLIDFSSNDYLGFSKNTVIAENAQQILNKSSSNLNGSTGSRLLSGNLPIHLETESVISNFHESESSLLYNSGYDANIGFFSCVPQRGDVILYDELCHASIRDGIRLSNASAFKFGHNDLEELLTLIERHKKPASEIYIATESVFSMDGDSPDLARLCDIAESYNSHLVVDEAHALGVFGEHGSGLVQQLGLHQKVFARIMTFGKGLGCHGAAILGSEQLREYLVNFSRSFIYTTAMSPHSAATIMAAYAQLAKNSSQTRSLQENILHFNREVVQLGIKPLFVKGKSAIQSAIIPGNVRVKQIAERFQQHGFDVKAILSPTVPEGQERLRICLHSFNSEAEIAQVLQLLCTFVFR